jgi:protein TonB
MTIDRNGNLANLKLRGPSEVLEDEAGRIIRRLPKMEPGKQEGVAANVIYAIPITFKLQ